MFLPLIFIVEKIVVYLETDVFFTFRAIWGSDVKTNLPKGKSVHTFPLPGSGVILTFILDILKWYGVRPNDDLSLLYHRMVESFKWGYGYRSKLGDPFDEEYRENITQVTKRHDEEEYICSKSYFILF